MFPTGTTAGPIRRLSLATFGLFLILTPAMAQTDPAVATTSAATSVAKVPVSMTAADIEAASYTGGDLPAGQSPLTAKVQVLLDRSGISPGVVDGWRGGMSESAVKAFQRRAGLPMTGRMDHAVWDLLQACEQLIAVGGIGDQRVEDFSQPVESPTITSKPIEMPQMARDALDSAGISLPGF